MANMNKVILAGNLTRDPEIKRTNNGNTVAQFGLALNRRYLDANQQWQEDTTFVDVEAWKQGADTAAKLTKGWPVLIEGRLKMDTWQDRTTGQQRSKLKIVADRLSSQRPLEDRSDGNQPPQQQQQQSQGYTPQQQPPQQQQPPPQQNYQAPQQQQQPPPQQTQQQAPPPPRPASPPPPAPFDNGNSNEPIDDIPF